MLTQCEQEAINDRLEGFELVDFLQVPIEAVLLAALENDWINPQNYDDLMEYVGLKQ